MGSGLIGVVLPGETPSVKLDKVVSEPMVKIGSDECSMVLVSKVFLAKVPDKGFR